MPRSMQDILDHADELAKRFEAVEAARRAGISWKRIGIELGISAQAVQQRYGTTTKRA